MYSYIISCTVYNNQDMQSWKSFCHVPHFATPWTIESMKFSRPEYWSGYPLPSPGDLPNPGIGPSSPALQVDSLPAESKGKPKSTGVGQFSSVQFSLSVVSDSLRPHELQHARPPCPSPTPAVHPNSCVSNWRCYPAISSCHPLLLLPPIPSSMRAFSNESTLRMRWPKYWSFSFSIRPSNEHPGLISFRMDWLDLLHSSKASILRHSAFFTVQLSHPYMTTGKP